MPPTDATGLTTTPCTSHSWLRGKFFSHAAMALRKREASEKGMLLRNMHNTKATMKPVLKSQPSLGDVGAVELDGAGEEGVWIEGMPVL